MVPEKSIDANTPLDESSPHGWQTACGFARAARKVRWELPAAVGLAAVLSAIASLAPCEATMGNVQRVFYVHVPAAWLSLLGLLVMAGSGALYLRTRNQAWDQWSQAAAELGWICCGLTLATGSLWAHAAWGTWWTWDPRLTATFILWMIYSACLILRAQVDDPHRRGRLSAVFAVIGALDVPLVIVAAHWFRGIHPPSVALAPAMRVALWACVAAFTALFGVLLTWRRARLQSHSASASRERQTASSDFTGPNP
jgi:heme exporter protein C